MAMEGDPAQFESIGSRLGFRIAAEDPEGLSLVWHGTRFPALLCLGIALALLFLSVPIFEAIRQRGFHSPVGSLWYFPVMNLILLGISLFLLSLKRTILFDHKKREILFHKRTIFRTIRLCADYDEVAELRLGMDQVHGGFAARSSTAGQKFPVPSLRLVLTGGETVLLDRGGKRRLEALGKLLSRLLEKPLHTEENLS